MGSRSDNYRRGEAGGIGHAARGESVFAPAFETPRAVPPAIRHTAVAQAKSGDVVPRFMSGLGSCDGLEGLCDLVADTTGGLGVGPFHYLYAQQPKQRTGNALVIEISTIRSDWLSRYHEAGYAKSDIWAQTAIARRAPTVWSEVSAGHQLTKVQQQMRAEAREAGLYDGITIPVRGRSGFALVGFSTQTPRRDGIVTIKRCLSTLATIAGLVHARLDAGGGAVGGPAALAPPATSLSPRQTEVLQWAALGKTDWEIAAILNISEKAVKFHFAAARRKLEAANRTHAVAKALSFGAIEPV